jgi:hypothetical protein
MEELNQLFFEMELLKRKYDEQSEKNKFNVFTAMYKDNEEVRLHSRFISYILSPISGHGMNNVFLNHFIREVLKINENDFEISKCEVIPNEFNKKEENEIDLLIKNRSTKQAIIIENKIEAKDSYHEDKEEGYRGQLERYFNQTIDKGYKQNQTFVYYLTKNRLPSELSLGMLRDKNQNWKGPIFYGNEIRGWLKKCIEVTPTDKNLVKDFIFQYLNLINKMTNNDLDIDQKLELKNRVSENLGSSKYLIDNFKHVKWHTIDHFWNKLKKAIELHFKNARIFPDKEIEFHKTIDAVAHFNKNINHGILFDFEDGKTAYISGLNTLSWGIINEGWFSFEDIVIEKIILSDFSEENTYQLINKDNTEKAVELIIIEILKEKEDNFKNLKINS